MGLTTSKIFKSSAKSIEQKTPQEIPQDLGDKEETETSSEEHSLSEKKSVKVFEAGDKPLNPDDESTVMRRKAEFLQTKSKFADTRPPEIPAKNNFFASWICTNYY